jgi:hypothetical protein
MISFSTDGYKLKLIVETNKNYVLHLYWDCGKELHAELLRDHLHETLNGRLEVIRREAYEKGWKDAKAKRRKEDWFSRWWK